MVTQMATQVSTLNGFGNYFESEAMPDVLIKGRNSPQHVPFGLYAEQINGTAFTVSRSQAFFTWFYRLRPSVLQGEFKLKHHAYLSGSPFTVDFTPPTPMRFNPRSYHETKRDFVEGLMTLAGNGSIQAQEGAAIHLFEVTLSMTDTYFYNADGELLIVPQEGKLAFHTECGVLHVAAGEILLMPRGMKFQVKLLSERARGYMGENFGSPFKLPELGILGVNGSASRRDFLAPTACYEERSGRFKLIAKFNGKLWEADIDHSPLDVVAWHGNYVPYIYDLALFKPFGTVSKDHPDPSIFTLLTSSSVTPGVANLDFIIFPPRWMVAAETFRPPYFHRNIMSEFMGLIHGVYEAKQEGFIPGGATLHNRMSAHGPDAKAYAAAIDEKLKPTFQADTLAFMFESYQSFQLTESALHAPFRQKHYLDCWKNLSSSFKMPRS